MKITLIIVGVALASIASGAWISKNLETHYFIEEYYNVQNLDPNNEKDAELLRQKIQKLMRDTIPAKYRPDSEKFQCFKIISESVFFCSVDTYRKKVAEPMKKLLQDTIPGEMGWLPIDEATSKFENLKKEIESNQTLIKELNRQLDKFKKPNHKQLAEEKKFIKTNDLFKKNQELLEKKLTVLEKLIEQASNPENRTNYQFSLEDTKANLSILKDEIAEFKSKNKSFAEDAEHRDVLELEIAQMKEKNEKDQIDFAFLEEALNQPNRIGKVADINELQLIPDETRRKYMPVQKPSNAIWFALTLFFVLTNFVFRLRPRTMVSFQEDGTMTEARIN